MKRYSLFFLLYLLFSSSISFISAVEENDRVIITYGCHEGETGKVIKLLTRDDLFDKIATLSIHEIKVCQLIKDCILSRGIPEGEDVNALVDSYHATPPH